MRNLRFLAPALAILTFAFAGVAQADTSPGGASATPTSGTPTSPTSTTPTTGQTGGAGVGAPASAPSTRAHPTVPGVTAKIINGIAYAPSFAPMAVKRIIWAGNQIRHKPYVWGGGHGTFKDVGYDCSGSVSYVLHAARLIKTSMDSSQYESWGQSGVGQWVTVYANPGHAFLEVAGIRLDTSSEGDVKPVPGTGPRWHALLQRTSGFQPRHPVGY